MKGRPRPSKGLLIILASCLIASLTWEAWPDEKGQGRHEQKSMQGRETRKKPVKIRMQELHRLGGVPRGWRFTLPGGNPEAGREVFVAMECYSCHKIKGESFPASQEEAGKEGPDLTGMGAHHPSEYLAEAIIDPNAVIIIDNPRWVGQDGLSIMPSYNDILTLQQLIDLVAYLKSLTGEMPHAPASYGHPHEGGGHNH